MRVWKLKLLTILELLPLATETLHAEKGGPQILFWCNVKRDEDTKGSGPYVAEDDKVQ